MPNKPSPPPNPTSRLGPMSREQSLRDAGWVAEFLNVDPSWVETAIQSGTLPSIQVGDVVRFDPEAIKAWVRGDRSNLSAPAQQHLSILAALTEQLKSLQATRAAPPGAAAVTVEQAGSQLGCAKTRIFELLLSGQLRRGKKVGRRTMVRTSSITTFSNVAPKSGPARPQKAHSSRPETRAEILRNLKQRR